jgi:hypothetical protein
VAWAWLGIGSVKPSAEPARRIPESIGKALAIVMPVTTRFPDDNQFHFGAARC